MSEIKDQVHVHPLVLSDELLALEESLHAELESHYRLKEIYEDAEKAYERERARQIDENKSSDVSFFKQSQDKPDAEHASQLALWQERHRQEIAGVREAFERAKGDVKKSEERIEAIREKIRTLPLS